MAEDPHDEEDEDYGKAPLEERAGWLPRIDEFFPGPKNDDTAFWGV